MAKRLFVLGAMIAGLMFSLTASAIALPAAKAPGLTAKNENIIQVRKGRGRGMRRGGRSFRSFRGGGRKFGRPRGFRPRGIHRRSSKRRRGRGIRRFRSRYYGYRPYVPYYDSYYYDDDCGWLRRKWKRTGKRIWYRRYKRCLVDY